MIILHACTRVAFHVESKLISNGLCFLVNLVPAVLLRRLPASGARLARLRVMAQGLVREERA